MLATFRSTRDEVADEQDEEDDRREPDEPADHAIGAARLIRPEPGASPVELKYHHFSLVMNRRRRLAFFTAVNIDGRTAQSFGTTSSLT